MIHAIAGTALISTKSARIIHAISRRQLNIDEKKALKWLMVGAKPSDTVHSLLSGQGILLQYDLMKKNATPDVIAESMSKWRTVKAERDARRAQVRQAKRKAPAPAEETPKISKSE